MGILHHIPTVKSINCPYCNKGIEMHLVKDALDCPHCKTSIKTNIQRAYNESIIAFFAMLVLWIPLSFLINHELRLAASSAVFIAILYLSHIWYKINIEGAIITEQKPQN